MTAEWPDRIARPYAEEFLAATDGHSIRLGDSQIADLKAVLAGELAPSLHKKIRKRHGVKVYPENLTLTQALRACMSYTAGDETVMAAREKLTELLYWKDPDKPVHYRGWRAEPMDIRLLPDSLREKEEKRQRDAAL